VTSGSAPARAPSLSRVDPSALIFVALAVAWAVYLIPKALGSRQPVSRRRARLVPRPSSDPSGRSEHRSGLQNGSLDVEAAAETPTPGELRARRVAAARAARRRLRVVSLILLINVTVAILSFLHVLAWLWALVPVAVLAVWLVACRLMVRRERGQRPRSRIPAEPERPRDDTDEIAAVPVDVAFGAPVVTDPDSWDPVPVTLPTYVSKPVAPRSVSTIDLDSTGVWSSGRSDSDSLLVREAGARKDAAGPTARRRAVGD